MTFLKNLRQIFNTNKFVIVFIFFLISLLTFIFLPITDDAAVFFAGARQADYIGENYIANAFKSWELKSVCWTESCSYGERHQRDQGRC